MKKFEIQFPIFAIKKIDDFLILVKGIDKNALFIDLKSGYLQKKKQSIEKLLKQNQLISQDEFKLNELSADDILSINNLLEINSIGCSPSITSLSTNYDEKYKQFANHSIILHKYSQSPIVQTLTLPTPKAVYSIRLKIIFEKKIKSIAVEALKKSLYDTSLLEHRNTMQENKITTKEIWTDNGPQIPLYVCN